MFINQQSFGYLPDNREAILYTIENNKGSRISITNFGTIITNIQVADKNGVFENVALGFEDLKQYTEPHPHFGAICGRYANRIKNAEFTIAGTQYNLEKNENGNTLHGGSNGFGKVLWDSKITDAGSGVEFTYLSPDMEGGFPGNLKISLFVSFNEFNELILEYKAETDKPTFLNLTHHDYFNLNACKTDIKNHELELNSKSITENDAESIPTGKILPVENTAYDFLIPKKIGKDIDKVGVGYDNNYIIERTNQKMAVFAARVTDPESGRIMEVYTTEPAVQLYTANFLDGTLKGSHGIPYNKHYGICLETQHYPDAPHHPGFPSTQLNPGESYYQKTVYKFLITND